MKKVLSIITTTLALAALFAFSVFAADGAKSDTGVFSALILAMEGYAKIFYTYFQEIADPIYQAIVWFFDQIWGYIEELISGALS